MESALRALLIAHAPLSALISTRLYWGNYPQGVADPAVRMNVVSGAPGFHMQGTDGLTDSLVQIDIRSWPPSSAFEVRDAIVARLHAKRQTQAGIKFVTFLRSERQLTEEATDGLYSMVQLDFDIWSGVAA